MKTREQKIEAIYNKIANKELSFGCLLRCTDEEENFSIKLLWYKDYYYGYILLNDYELPRELPRVDWGNFSIDDMECSINTWYYKIIWHPVMIGDVFEWTHNEQRIMDKNQGDYEGYYLLWGMSRIRTSLANIWSKPTKPIEEQSEECIDYIFNLL